MQKAQEKCGDELLTVRDSYICNLTHMSEVGLVTPLTVAAAVGGGGPPSSCASSSSIPTHTQAAVVLDVCLVCCHQLFTSVDTSRGHTSPNRGRTSPKRGTSTS